MSEDKKATKVLFSGEPALKLLEHRFNTSEEHLPEMTLVSGREAFMMAGIKTINELRAYQAQLAGYNAYRKTIYLIETYPLKLENYNQYIQDLKQYNKNQEAIDKKAQEYEKTKPETIKKPSFLIFVYYLITRQEEKLQPYKQYKADLKTFNNNKLNNQRIYPPDMILRPHKPTKPKAVKKPTPFFASDRFNYWLMKFKRSVGGRGLDDVRKLTEIGLEVGGESEDMEDIREST